MTKKELELENASLEPLKRLEEFIEAKRSFEQMSVPTNEQRFEALEGRIAKLEAKLGEIDKVLVVALGLIESLENAKKNP